MTTSWISRERLAKMRAAVVRRMRSDRRGSALILSLILTVALAGLATSAIYMGGNATLLATSLDRERDFKYASEAALAMGKSRLNFDPLAVPTQGYTQLLTNAPIQGADGKPVPDVTVNMYVGPSSSNTGQFGKFVSVVTEARDARGARFVRRLELAQESFAKFAYWTNTETNNGSVIWFANGDQLWGPVWSNDVIHVSNSNGSPTFWNDVGTAQYIDGAGQGIFKNGYSERQRAITLPNNTVLANLSGYATSGGLNFTAPNSSAVDAAMMRLEFVFVDLNGNGAADDNEGFLKVYKAKTGTDPEWVRGDWSNRKYNCGAWYKINAAGERRFYPIALHSQTWLINFLKGSGATYNGFSTSNQQFKYMVDGSVDDANTQTAILQYSGTGRCYLGGAPELAGVERLNKTPYSTAANTDAKRLLVYGGTDTTFTPNGNYGDWQNWGGAVNTTVSSARADAAQLFPLYRGLNPGTKGVIYVKGTTGISGTLHSRITLYATGNVALLDDLRYAVDPSTGRCVDIFGVISSNNIMVADNALNGPQTFSSNANTSNRNYDDTQDFFVHGVLMALNTSFGAENYSTGPSDGNGCEGKTSGRGCLYLTGGLIQQSRGAVATMSSSGSTGYVKRYSYDRCALYNPPPYFPTTGRYTDNRYYEIDPINFDVAKLYENLTPTN